LTTKYLKLNAIQMLHSPKKGTKTVTGTIPLKRY